MVDWYGKWTYEPNTPEEEKCDYDRMGRVITTYWTYDYSREIKREV